MNVKLVLFTSLLCFPTILAWEVEDFALFDVVEDVNKNFYELLEISQEATSTEVRKAYRRLSLQLHPDKNKDPDADNQFRKLVSVYEILKDESLRGKYNDVLEHGLPDWRQPVFYYRKVKKMGLLDLALFLSVILTFGHYLIIWSAYLERKFELEEIFKPKKKKEKKGKKSRLLEEEEDEVVVLPEELAHLVVKPTYMDVLPVIAVKYTYHFFCHQLPSTLVSLVSSYRRGKEEDGEEEEEMEEEDKYRQRSVRTAGPTVFEMAEDAEAINYTRQVTDASTSSLLSDEDSLSVDKKKGQEWSSTELDLLVKAIIKFPGGTMDRWEKVARMVGRAPKEVMDMVKKFKSTQVMSEMNARVVVRKGAAGMSVQNVETSTLDPAERGVVELGGVKLGDDEIVSNGVGGKSGGGVKSEKDKNSKVTCDNTQQLSQSSSSPVASSSLPSSSSPLQPSSPSSLWSQQQQKCLEMAMQQVGRQLEDRWDRIASLVEGKSKIDCLQRVKHLSNLVKKKKQEFQGAHNTPATSTVT